MFSDEGSYRSPYQFASSVYNGDVCSGCSCDEDVLTDCSGSTMYIFRNILDIKYGTRQNVNLKTKREI